MPDNAAPRPTQVTIAAGLVMAGSVVVVLTAFDQIAGLRSADTRESVQDFLGTPFGEQLGLGLQDALSLLRVLTMVAAACATAAAILGYQVLRRSRPARLVLTLLAAPLFLAGMVVGGFLPAVVVGSIAMLWFQPARDWIDGKAPRPAPTPPAFTSTPSESAPPASPTTQAQEPPAPAPPAVASEPRAYPGFGAATAAAPTGVDPAGPPAYAAPAGPARPARPPALMWACGLAWAGSALVFLMMLVSVAVVLAVPDTLMDELYRQNPDLRSEGITRATLRATVLLFGALLIIWSAAAAVVAVFAWRGRRWAWTVLLVSACSASLLCLLAALGGPVLLLALALCAPAIPLLLRPEVRAYVAKAPR